MIRLEPHWAAKLLGRPVLSIALTDGTINIVSKKGSTSLIIDCIETLPTFRKNFAFGTIVFPEASYWGFRGKKVILFLEAVQRRWYLSKHSDVLELSSRWQQYFDNHYVRTSAFIEIHRLAKKVQSKYKLSPQPHILPEEKRKPFLYVDELVQFGEKVLTSSRMQFVRNESERYASLFDNVENNPLTTKQRQACVVDDDNNLVLAGAGTGKTSTIVGKSGYLVQSDKAKPDEILLLAFGKKAAEELQERILEKLKISTIRVSTFHKLGKSIITAVDNQSSSVSDLATDEKKRHKFVNDRLNQLLKQPEYGKKAVTYFAKYLHADANPFDFKTKGEYFEYLAINEVRSLKGDRVKSHGELLIANYLFVNGVEYQYEKPYEFKTDTSDFQQYKPDFYLTAHGIYLEHYGVDRDSSTAPYINKEKYNNEIKWKRQLHQSKNTVCLETFHYEKQEGNLLSNLEDKLDKAGVDIEPMPEDSILETLREFGQITELSKLLSQLLSGVKRRCQSIEEAVEIARGAKNSAQAMAALDLLVPILESYDALLEANGEIDFNDMISRATKYVQDGKYKPKWKYILVDEFQDIAASRAELIKALRDKSENCVIFCVGDDWQSIYRFAGGDLNYTTKFGEKFGHYATTTLDKTFRFNNSICDIASRFVTRNPFQERKKLTTNALVNSPAISVMRRIDSCDVDHIDEVLGKISTVCDSGSSVYVISRYNFSVDKFKLKAVASRYPNLSVTRTSMHGSKGAEADYVVVVGLERGKNGFPSEKVTHPLLELYLPPLETFSNAEERRLFYVAITRAKKRVYLIADMEKASIFTKELLMEGAYDLCLDEFETPIEQIEFESLKCPECETGTLTQRTNDKTGDKFLGCSNYSWCEHTESSCSQCSGAMKREGRFKVCVSCSSKVPMCTVCNGEMRKRASTGHWGCSNFRGINNFPTCTHQENRISSD